MFIAKDGQLSRKIPTIAREVFDVSGAGDTVIVALSVALATGHDLEQAAHFANVAAGVVVGKLGTAVATPAEILNFQRQCFHP
jgi:D-beta-D-heptose 7-phosphate kinase/D-beta-D-heptose 1-phosphate adenosyltransferase